MLWQLSGGAPLIDKDRLWETYRIRNAESGNNYALGWHVNYYRGTTLNCFRCGGHFH